jgi:hypothetical protein
MKHAQAAGSAIAAVLQLMARQLPAQKGTYHHAFLAPAILRMLDMVLPSLFKDVSAPRCSKQVHPIERAEEQCESGYASDTTSTHALASCSSSVDAMNAAQIALARVFAQLPITVAAFGNGVLYDAFSCRAARTDLVSVSVSPGNIHTLSKQACNGIGQDTGCGAMFCLRQHLMEPGTRQGVLPMLQMELSDLLQEGGRVRVPEDIRAWLRHQVHLMPRSELCAVESSSLIEMHETSWLASLKKGYHEQYVQPEVRCQTWTALECLWNKHCSIFCYTSHALCSVLC